MKLAGHAAAIRPKQNPQFSLSHYFRTAQTRAIAKIHTHSFQEEASRKNNSAVDKFVRRDAHILFIF